MHMIPELMYRQTLSDMLPLSGTLCTDQDRVVAVTDSFAKQHESSSYFVWLEDSMKKDFK